jgi:dimeric dUTPase (all-alpha-NTP-PPase superfamily)
MIEETKTETIDPSKLKGLELVFYYQNKLQERLGTWDKIHNNPSLKQQWINQMILAMFEETVEIMRETPYKNPNFVPFGWKKTQLGDSEKFKGELVDLLHFFVNLCIGAELGPDELVQRYLAKNKINHERQDHGY